MRNDLDMKINQYLKNHINKSNKAPYSPNGKIYTVDSSIYKCLIFLCFVNILITGAITIFSINKFENIENIHKDNIIKCHSQNYKDIKNKLTKKKI